MSSERIPIVTGVDFRQRVIRDHKLASREVNYADSFAFVVILNPPR